MITWLAVTPSGRLRYSRHGVCEYKTEKAALLYTKQKERGILGTDRAVVIRTEDLEFVEMGTQERYEYHERMMSKHAEEAQRLLKEIKSAGS